MVFEVGAECKPQVAREDAICVFLCVALGALGGYRMRNAVVNEVQDER